jgi:hypothetical protein
LFWYFFNKLKFKHSFKLKINIMGYGIMPYRVNLARLGTRFGNEKTSKRTKAKTACLRYLYELGDENGGPSNKELVAELIDNSNASHQNLGHKYWYAIKGLVEHLGRHLNNYAWYPASADFFWDNPFFKLYDIDAPMEIPEPDDFPTVFVLRYAAMSDDFLAMCEEKLEDEEQLSEMKAWVKKAKQYRQDLVLFYH